MFATQCHLAFSRFFFNDTATTEIYTLSLHDALPISILPIMKARVPVYEYAPRLVKKAVTGSGAADKDQVRRMVRLLLGLGAAPLILDASDALAVAICHAHALPFHRMRESAAQN